MSEMRSKKLSEKEMAELPILRQVSEKEEKYLREIHEYEFFNLEEPGLMNTFTYGNTKKNHTFTFLHGGKYRLPRFIANHIESKSIPIWIRKPDGTGRMEKTRAGNSPRFRMSQLFAA